jgi:hypothetical protein
MAAEEQAVQPVAVSWCVNRDEVHRWRKKERDALYRAACARGPLAAFWRRRAETFHDRKLRASGQSSL